MSSDDKIKKTVKESYGKRWKAEGACCDSSASCSRIALTLDTPHEALLEELMPLEGKRILDIGSGTGDTVLRIAKEVGKNGKAVGIDLTTEGVTKATKKAAAMGLDKVTEFRVADAEKLPFENNYFDAVISECVVCLTPNKQKTLNEKARVLKPGGKIVMHDVVAKAPMPKAVQTNPQLYCGCIGGAVTKEDYVKMLEQTGLTKIKAIDYSDEPAVENIDLSIKRALDSQILLTATGAKDDRDFQEIVNFVRKGGVGYMLFVAEKPIVKKH